MLVKLIKYMKGYVLVRVSGYSPERFINLCSHHNILLWDMKNEGDSYLMYMSVQGFRRLKPILKKTKTRPVIVEKHGLPFFLHKYRKRKMFFGGIFFCAVIIYVLSLFIWNIHIDGNHSRTDDVILEYLKTEDTYHGIKKKNIDCEKIVADIRKEFDDIIWASAEVRGTRLFIKVKENTDGKAVQEKAVSEEASDLIAEKDGIISEIITRAGTPAVGVGDVVKAGDILVSGRIEVLDDAGEVSEYQYNASDSDIYAKTVYEYEDSFPLAYENRTYTNEEKKSFYLKVFDKKINIWKRKITFEEYDVVTDEKQWKLGDNFYLPISFGTSVHKEFESTAETYSEEGALGLANDRLNQYIEELSKKGVQIVENNVKILVENDTCIARGKIQVIEQIGERAPTEVLPNPKDEEERIQADEHNGNDT